MVCSRIFGAAQEAEWRIGVECGGTDRAFRCVQSLEGGRWNCVLGARAGETENVFGRRDAQRPFVKMPLMHRNDATMQRHALVNTSMLSSMHTCVHSYMLTV